MTEKIEISEKAISAISSAAERLIGYFYAGLLPIVILSVQYPTTIKSFVETTGGLFAIVISFALGIGLYTLYFKLIGELFLYPIQHTIHLAIDLFRGERTSSIGLMRDMGVRIGDLRDAYTAIRNEFFRREVRTLLEIDHGELHVLYLTAIIMSVAYFLIEISGGHPSKIYLSIAGFSFLAAIVADTRQHTRECLLMKRQQNEIREYLKENHFIRSGRAAKQALA